MQRAQLIERLGFDGIWLGDSVGRVGWPVPDPLAWLTAAAAATERIELGTAVIQVPLRRPVELAQRLMSLHALSGGRFAAGLGTGISCADRGGCAARSRLPPSTMDVPTNTHDRVRMAPPEG